MRKALQTIILFLIIGAVVNVLVAWAFAAFNSPWFFSKNFTRFAERLTHEDTVLWGIYQYDVTGGGAVVSSRSDRTLIPESPPPSTNHDPYAIIPGWAPELTRVDETKSRRSQYLIARHHGFPMSSIGGVLEYNLPQAGMQIQYVVVSGIEVPSTLPRFDPPSPLSPVNAFQIRFLPLRPIWTGFLFNTLLYGLLAWCVVAGVSGARRAIRRRKGRCPACNYPIGTAEVCTECGRPVPKPAQPAQHETPTP